jgi:pimeloyl-ACP methyl ester carboxylesterase
MEEEMTPIRARIPALLLAVCCAAGAVAASAQSAPPPSSPQAAWTRPPAPGRLLEVAPGRRLHILCKGENTGPTVIVVAGMSQYTSLTGYGKVQDGIAPFARVCIFDRAGLGWSDPQPANWTQEGMVRDLHALIAAAGIASPYILVGHSMGGVISRLYVDTYRDEVAGLVLVDAAAGHDFVEFEASIATDGKRLDEALAHSRPGVPVSAMPPGTPPEIGLAFTPESLRGLKGEVEALLKMPPERKQVGAPGSLGALRLIVIRRGKMAEPPTKGDLIHRDEQKALARMSSDSVVMVAEGSGHLVSVDAPQVMIDATRRMVDAVRRGVPVS